MKVRLLENVTHAGLNGCRGQILDLPNELAEDLERHGHASFDLSVDGENKSPRPKMRTESVAEPEAKVVKTEEEDEPAAKKAKKAHR